jgi:bla regulator protein blaR1
MNLRRSYRVTIRNVLALIACALLSGSALAQGADTRLDKTAPMLDKAPEFEVATIKPHPPGDFITSVGGPPGRFEATNVTAKMLVQLAFNLPALQVSGGPSWVASQHFDVAAKISDAQWQDLNKLDYDQRNQSIQHMLQSLLAQRFQLAVSHQQKDLLVFALVVAKTGAKLRLAGTSMPESSQRGELAIPMDQYDVPVSALASFLSAHFGRTVLDCTGLSKRYDISLKIEVPEENSPDEVNSAIFRALEDQLGLKLVTRRYVVDTISIDHMEQPSDN